MKKESKIDKEIRIEEVTRFCEAVWEEAKCQASVFEHDGAVSLTDIEAHLGEAFQTIENQFLDGADDEPIIRHNLCIKNGHKQGNLGYCEVCGEDLTLTK